MSAIPQPRFPVEGPRRAMLLEAGDHLTSTEFERRYCAMPEVKKAELIEGVVWMASLVRYKSHASPHARMMIWLGNYWMATPGSGIADNGTVRFDALNEPQPDAALIIESKNVGQSHISDDDYVEGPPELVLEVASSSVSFDLHAKKRVYQRFGVLEYLAWRVIDKAIDWFILRDGQYVNLPVHANGSIESETFPGLRLDPKAMTNFDMATVLTVLQEGIDSLAHAAFVARLAAPKAV